MSLEALAGCAAWISRPDDLEPGRCKNVAKHRQMGRTTIHGPDRMLDWCGIHAPSKRSPTRLERLKAWRIANPERARAATMRASLAQRLERRGETLQKKVREALALGISRQEIERLVFEELDNPPRGAA